MLKHLNYYDPLCNVTSSINNPPNEVVDVGLRNDSQRAAVILARLQCVDVRGEARIVEPVADVIVEPRVTRIG